MIVVDTSALIALVQSEAAADQCQAALRNQDQLIISAGTYAEALIVATMRGLREEMDKLFEITIFQIVPITPERARLAAGKPM